MLLLGIVIGIGIAACIWQHDRIHQMVENWRDRFEDDDQAGA